MEDLLQEEGENLLKWPEEKILHLCEHALSILIEGVHITCVYVHVKGLNKILFSIFALETQRSCACSSDGKT